MPNNILRAIIPELASSYEYTLIDAPAGLEHLNRRIVSDIDDLFVIADPSSKALANIKRLREVSRQVGIVFKHLYLVGNYRFDASTESFLRDSGEHYVGRVAPDPNVAEYNLRGQALSDLPMDSDAVQSVRSILLSTGFPLENEG